MDKTIGGRIAALRRQRGMTQEALARALGVSGGAVSKWETDASCPDIALLCPLARALDTNVDTLLAFEKTLTREQIAALSQELVTLCRAGDLSGAQARLDGMLREYPGNCALKLSAAMTMNVFALCFPDADEVTRAAWDAQKRALYESVRRAGDAQERQAAASALAGMALAAGELDAAQALLDELPEQQEDTTLMRVQLHQRRGERDKALEVVQKRLYRSASQAMQCVMLMGMDLTQDEEKALEMAEIYVKLDELFGIGGGMGAGALMQQYLRMGRTQQALDCLTKMADAVTQPPAGPNPLLFAPTLAPKPGAGDGTRELRAMLLRGLRTDEAFDGLRDAPEFARACEKIEASLNKADEQKR